MLQDKSQRISSGPNGIQSMPRSRSQARAAAIGWRRPRFSYAAMVIKSVLGVSIATMMLSDRAGVIAIR
ncbi:hypothetical protein [Streptomyces sp. V4I2]|uniref:hypothetical protein n=1 Tax=Streptomyces sp. V4I2 TaxID=3042280 RepID=UPI002784F354|nr:hypothetical protein [Streptomyces sp. V4I2]MDQ1042522.1 hypothetical protein [Streptomyces sp. V4I2]